MDVDIVISINIYKSPKTLELQLDNIKKNVLNSYSVILNCNKYMFDHLSTKELPENVFINPEIIEKERFTGTITKGIVSNMYYVINNNFKFNYFIILSGRTIFYKNIKTENLDKLQKKLNNIDELNNPCYKKKIRNLFPFFRKTLLGKHYINLGYFLIKCSHEGLCFNYYVIKNILNFLNNNNIIKEDIFNFNNCVEEFALQTISTYEINTENLYHSFIYINTFRPLQEDTYTEKIEFLD